MLSSTYLNDLLYIPTDISYYTYNTSHVKWILTISTIPNLLLPIARHQGKYQTNYLFLLQTQYQGVTCLHYTLLDHINTYHLLPTGIYLGGQLSLSHQGCLVVVSVSPCNHIFSYAVHRIFPVYGFQTTLYRRYGPPKTCNTNKSLLRLNSLPYIGPLFACLSLKILL